MISKKGCLFLNVFKSITTSSSVTKFKPHVGNTQKEGMVSKFDIGPSMRKKGETF